MRDVTCGAGMRVKDVDGGSKGGSAMSAVSA